MKRFGLQLLRRFAKEELGQSVVVVAITITSMMALAATSVEVGHIYYAYQRLVASTNAAALAGGQEMSNALDDSTNNQYQTDVQTAVDAYSSENGKYNANSMLQNDAIESITYRCSTTVSSAPLDVSCQAPPGSVSGYNVITVVQQATVNLWFGGLVGMPRMTMQAESSAAMKGGNDTPYNLAIIIDNTASMQQPPKNDPNCTQAEIVCAIQGFTVMLQNMDPCSTNTTCTASSPFVDDVALFVFPPISTADSANDYKALYCGKSATSVPYNFTNVTPGSLNLDMTTATLNGIGPGAYEMIPFTDTYKANDSSTAALTGALAEAVGYTGTGCTGLSAPGGQGTYYAQVIYQAQQALYTASGGANPNGTKNVMIILSDGDATACNSEVSVVVSGCQGSGLQTPAGSTYQIVADNCPKINGTTAAAPCVSPYSGQPINGTEANVVVSGKTETIQPAGWNNPNYPSALGECGQAVQQAQAATAAGTTVYAIAFGSETSGGCLTDQTYTLTGLSNGAQTWPSGTYSKEPCNAIAAMASNPNTFYSDDTGGCPAITTANGGFKSLAAIFQAVVSSLTSSRLIPNGT